MMSMKIGRFFKLLKASHRQWVEDNGRRLGAALAFYSIFSLAPLLVFCVSLAGLVYGEDAAQGRVARHLEDIVGRGTAESIQGIIEGASKPAAGLLATALGLAALLIGAAGVFNELQDALNSVFGSSRGARPTVSRFLKSRLLSLLTVLAIGLLLLVSIAVSTGLARVTEASSGFAVTHPVLLQLIHVSVSLVVMTVIFAVVFKVLPDAGLAWSDVWAGAALTSVLFNLGRVLIGYYLGRIKVGTVYGAGSSLVVILLWVYYSTQIFFFGAAFIQVGRSKTDGG
jgi:membrane protein